MKITIPEVINANLTQIKNIWFEVSKPSGLEEGPSETVASLKINLKHIELVEFVEFHDDLFKDCTKINYRVEYKGGSTRIYKFDTKHQATYRLKDLFDEPPVARYKVSSTFEDSSKGRHQIFEAVNQKILATNDLQINPKGSKNLIYFTVYFNNGYTDLLNVAIESLLSHTNTQFDILIITDKQTRYIIEELPFTEKIKPLFHMTPTPLDGVDASCNKLNVFDYSNIDEYDKILFLDCDVVAIGDVGRAFSNKLKQNTLYTAYNLNLTSNHFKSIHHGFEYLDEEFIQEMKANSQMPFNAGQFIFRNSNKMREHFANVRWMIDNWSGEYFFEQSFMNYYFSKAHITNTTILQPLVSITSAVTKRKSLLGENVVLVHFIVPPLNAAAKLHSIRKFLS
jgi:hypothetical protein